MRKYVSLFLIVLMFCAVISVGCGGGGSSSSSDHEQTENLNDDTGEYDPNDGGRRNSDAVTDLSTITADHTAQDGETLTGKLGAIVNISIADGAAVTINGVMSFFPVFMPVQTKR